MFYRIVFWGKFHQHFMSSFYVQRSHKLKNSVNFCTYGICTCKCCKLIVCKIDPWSLVSENTYFTKGCVECQASFVRAHLGQRLHNERPVEVRAGAQRTPIFRLQSGNLAAVLSANHGQLTMLNYSHLQIKILALY
jgi:hypothetical protein